MKTRGSSKKPSEALSQEWNACVEAPEKERERLSRELERVQKEANFYRTLVEKSNDIIYETDEQGRFTFANRATEHMIGYSNKELKGKHYLELVGADHRNEAARFYGRQYVQRIQNTYHEIPIIIKNGNTVWLGQQVQLMLRGDQITGFRAIARDVSKQREIEGELRKYQEQLEIMVQRRTAELKKKNEALELEILERKKAQSALWASEQRYRSLIETSPDAITVFDLSYHLQAINPRGLQLIGYEDSKDIIGKGILDVFAPKDRAHATKYLEQAGRRRELCLGEENPLRSRQLDLMKRDGTLFPAEIKSVLLRNGAGAMEGFMVIVRDITEHRLAEEAMQKTYAKMTLLINAISSILIAISEDNRIIYWNTEAEEEFGKREAEVLGQPLEQSGIQWDWLCIHEGISRCRKENGSVTLDNVKFSGCDGKEGILVLRINSILGEEFSGNGILIQGANVTRRKILERQLAQAQKLESIGQLAAGIAHEINTPTQYVGDNVRFLESAFQDLSGVLNRYEALKKWIKEQEAAKRLVAEVEEAIERADLDYLRAEIPKAIEQTLEGVRRVTRIVQSMKSFAHPGKEEKVAVDINGAIENTVVVARNEWKYVADVVTDLDPGLPPILCIPGEINQVLLNVLVNAAQAVSEVVGDGSCEKGKITIATCRDDAWVEIRISDTGRGIPDEIRSKIFDPFFTTKEAGKGTGQGLAICYTAIAERHGGSISFDTEIGRGTTFHIRLPIGDQGDD
jgi:PAS domain S-box-containing protein